MRAVIGIGGLLVGLGVLVWIMGFELGHDKAAIDAGNKATEQVNQIAGRDENGTPVKQSAALEVETTNGNAASVLVTSITPDSPYAKVWGLKRNDAIVEFGPLPVSQVATDTGSAEDQLMTAYQQNEPLTIYRDGNKMTLTPTSPLTPATPGAPAKSGNPLQNQLDAIQSQQIPTH
jgi:hypothetical protein